MLSSPEGWRRNALGYALGVMAALAMPPVFLFPLLIPSFAGLAWLIRNASAPRRAFADGWWWGWGFFTAGLYWMCIALLTDPAKFAWLIPFTLVGLHGALALIPAAAAWLFYVLAPRRAFAPVVFACVWMLAEFARGYLLTGFPWNLPGYAFAFSGAMSQSVSVIGIYGLSFVTVLAAAAPVAGWRYAACAWLGMAAMALGGAWRLEHAPLAYVEGVRLRLVQGNITELAKWDPALQAQHLRSYLELSQRPGYERVTHLIWPETAVPFVLNREPELIRLLMRVAPEHGALLTGGLRAEGRGGEWRVWNMLAVITRPDGVVAVYDKHHLVPFGEFVPLRRFLPLEKITPGAVDFSRGPGPQALTAPGAPPFSPLICYEVLFPDEAAPADAPVSWLLNITNDAWFGNSSGPYQHFHISRMRAIEQGLPLVRAANTGISAVTDGYGRVLARLDLNTQGVLDSGLPQAVQGGTLYRKLGHLWLLLLTGGVVLLTLWRRRRG
ncbi:MAG: apolipoprotein N-acyltransferase [Alphaproteobacteria bacterium]|nr:apolipoprotein N-acyltransferase [Alphaproteobacteria bacterium]